MTALQQPTVSRDGTYTRESIRRVAETCMYLRTKWEQPVWDAGARMGHDIALLVDYAAASLVTYCCESSEGRWLYQMIGDPVLAAALVAEVFPLSKFPSVQDLWQVCGLGTTRDFTVTQAEQFIRKFYIADPITEDLLDTLSIKTGRSRRRIKGYPDQVTLSSLVDWLVRPAYSPYIRQVCDQIGKVFQSRPDGDTRWQQYAGYVEQFRDENDAGRYADQCKQYLRDHRVFGDDRRIYQSGRIPIRQLEYRARINVLRDFLAEFYEQFHTKVLS